MLRRDYTRQPAGVVYLGGDGVDQDDVQLPGTCRRGTGTDLPSYLEIFTDLPRLGPVHHGSVPVHHGQSPLRPT